MKSAAAIHQQPATHPRCATRCRPSACGRTISSGPVRAQPRVRAGRGRSTSGASGRAARRAARTTGCGCTARQVTVRGGGGGDLLEHSHRQLAPARLVLSALRPGVSGVWRPVQAALRRGGGGGRRAGCGHWPGGGRGRRSHGHAARGDCHGGCLLRRLGKGRSR